MTGPAYFRDDVVIVKYLLENGAAPDLQARDEYGLTPIMHAAIGSYRLGTKNVVTNVNILKYLMERENIKRMEKIDALELAAAVLLSYTIRLILNISMTSFTFLLYPNIFANLKTA